MAQKYHINKHGVPAPCHAKKGNCPLGGDEQHFNSQEEAQEFADKQNAADHGLLPGVDESVYISREAYEGIFRPSFNDHGYQYTGPHKSTIEDSLNDPDFKELYDALPDNLKNSDEEWTLVPAGNIYSQMESHNLSMFENNREMRDKIIEEIKNEDPSFIDDSGYPDESLVRNMAHWSAKQVEDESNLKIDGRPMYVATESAMERNFAKEYIESGELDRYKKAISVEHVSEVDYDTFDSTFTFEDNGGYMVTGPAGSDFEDSLMSYYEDDPFMEVYDKLPEDLKNKEDSWRLVPERVAKEHLEYHVLSASEGNIEGYPEMVASAKRANPDNVEVDSFSVDKNEDLTPEFRSKVAEYSANKLINEEEYEWTTFNSFRR